MGHCEGFYYKPSYILMLIVSSFFIQDSLKPRLEYHHSINIIDNSEISVPYLARTGLPTYLNNRFLLPVLKLILTLMMFEHMQADR